MERRCCQLFLIGYGLPYCLYALCQICFAVAVGFLFVTIFYRGGSLLPCVITHSAVNTLSAFANKAGFTVEKQMLHGLVMMLIATAYTLILTKKLPKNQSLDWDDAEHR